MIAKDQLIEIDFDRLNPDPIHPFYNTPGESVRVPLYTAVIALSAHRCTDCGKDSERRRGLLAWLALRTARGLQLSGSRCARSTSRRPLARSRTWGDMSLERSA